MKLRIVLVAVVLLVLPFRALAAATMFACVPAPVPLAAVQVNADKGLGEHCHEHAAHAADAASQDEPAGNDGNPCTYCAGDCCAAGIADPREGMQAAFVANHDRFAASQRRFVSAYLEDPGRPPLFARG